MTEQIPISRANPLDRPTPDDAILSATDELVLELVRNGVSLRKAKDLVNRYSSERVLRQIRWLDARGPKRRASLLIAAIEHDYGEPVYVDGQ